MLVGTDLLRQMLENQQLHELPQDWRAPVFGHPT